MSDVPDLGLDLENLFQPAWAKGKAETKFANFTGNEGIKPERRGKREGFGGRGPRREGGGFGGGERPRFGNKPGGGKFGDRKKTFGRRDDNRGERRERPEPPAPLPEITVTFLPDEKGVEQLARQIKMTGRAYPLFQIAQLVLQKPERYSVRLEVKKKDDKIVQPIFVCALDDTPWLSEDEVVAHVLKNHFATFYQAEKTATEPPKGTYTFVAQCGMSGVILGPPNYHDYQNQLRKLHAERFSKMPFDVFKARVKIVKDEAVVKKWIEEQSFKTEYSALNVAEPLKLPTMEEVEKHFRATHKDTIVKQVETLVVDGVKSRKLTNRELYRLVRSEWEHQKYFPLQLATLLSKMFASHGLQFFKVNKTAVHVSVARPLYLDLETTPVSDGIRRIVNFINSTPNCTRKKLIESLAPSPKTEEKPAAETSAPAAPIEAQGDSKLTPAEPAALPVAEPTPEQTAVLVDLHWLIHAGAVLEFADGRMETAKKPAPKPPKPEKKTEQVASVPAERTAEERPATEGEIVSTEPMAQAEIAAETPPPMESVSPASEPGQTENASGDEKPAEEVPSPS
ncbi:MAG TPA: hypothetical protein VFV23_01875 [Verrucomicrobiae bacterium]|nr:hypothetical protein [Verrucomicrobiae bacterium]